MPLNPYTTSGAKISVAPAVTSEPANAAAYAALTWTVVNNVRSFAAFGDSKNIINAPVVGDGRMRKTVGSSDAGNMSITLYPDEGDAGQIALLAASDAATTVPVKIEFPSGSKLTTGGTVTIRYFLALVASQQETLGGNEDIVTAVFNLAITTKITKTIAT